jgi:hypothetical protein
LFVFSKNAGNAVTALAFNNSLTHLSLKSISSKFAPVKKGTLFKLVMISSV